MSSFITSMQTVLYTSLTSVGMLNWPWDWKIVAWVLPSFPYSTSADATARTYFLASRTPFCFPFFEEIDNISKACWRPVTWTQPSLEFHLNNPSLLRCLHRPPLGLSFIWLPIGPSTSVALAIAEFFLFKVRFFCPLVSESSSSTLSHGNFRANEQGYDGAQIGGGQQLQLSISLVRAKPFSVSASCARSFAWTAPCSPWRLSI